ncbi:ubiquitin-conjugating enzyme [Trypanosoma conorhini]|uniref:Ubiquitin-conjugating enzyme n=1 Tax=Trypanosoma conorhini TaxID=83891 RepID=A0A3R7LJS1_9TRYP|nr:ubiquitin-conjugating enzyme [Trypanosoma conorhini]RNF26009.1 ubiquitin-conjugating enzyme [Trypanosoma conorhini]
MAAAAAAIKRLAKEKLKLDESRVRDFYTCPLEDIFEWHFTLQGPENSPYEGGLYHGSIRFPRNYPFAPPDIIFFTESGRFEVGTKICSSISSYHPELWKPVYDIQLVLVALRLFMAQDEELGVGSLMRRYVAPEEKRRLARESHHFRCAACGMASAWEVWKTQMERHPPVSPEVGASLPKVTEGRRSDAASAGEAETAAATTVPAGSEVGSAAAAVETEPGGEETSTPAMKCNEAAATPPAPTSEAKATTQTKEEQQPQQRRDLDGDVTTPRYGVPSHAPEAAERRDRWDGTAAPALAEPAPPVYVRIQAGGWVLLRVQLKHLDAVIAACSLVCSAIMVKKWCWS